MPRKRRLMRPNAKKGKRAPHRPPHPGEAERMAARRVRALDLRKAGFSYRRIAGLLHVNVETAWSDVRHELDALAKMATAAAEDVREIELRRLDDWTIAMTKRATLGSINAVHALVRISERRSKLLGLDAVVRHELGLAEDGHTLTVVVADARARLAAAMGDVVTGAAAAGAGATDR